MPNHVQSIITISGTKESVERVKNRILVTNDFIEELKKRDDGLQPEFQLYNKNVYKVGTLTFNRLIPIPTNIFQGDLTSKNVEKYGDENCWLHWRRTNWGTKWDAYEVDIQMTDDDVMTIYFQTAWNAPMPYMEQLAKICVEEGCEMNGKFCDEDFDGNMGIYYIDDEVKELRVEYHDEDAELYEECWGWNPLENDEEFEDVDYESVEDKE